MKNQLTINRAPLLILIALAAFWLTVFSVVANADVIDFSWRYSAEEQAKISKFKITMDGGSNVIVDNIPPGSRAVSYDLVNMADQHTFGVFACNTRECSLMSNSEIYNPSKPTSADTFLITVKKVN